MNDFVLKYLPSKYQQIDLTHSERYRLAWKDRKGLTKDESNGGTEPDHNETTSNHNH